MVIWYQYQTHDDPWQHAQAGLSRHIGVFVDAAGDASPAGRSADTHPRLSCEGRIINATTGPKKSPLSNVGLVVDLAGSTVSFHGHSAPIAKVNPNEIYFRGKSRSHAGMDEEIAGTLDRVTGAVDASVFVGADLSIHIRFLLVCKPKTRLF